MKKLLIVSLVLNVAFVVATWSDDAPVAAEGGGAGPVAPEVACYDANGDGRLNVSDPVAFLSWLFRGGDAPEVCPTGGGEFVGLPDTGQTICSNSPGDISCAPECTICMDFDVVDCSGQDAHYATGCPDDEFRFVDNGDRTVTDTCTGLMWQKLPAPAFFWCEALRYCENLRAAGHDDWRLPNIWELQSIVDYGRDDPAIDPVFGPQPNATSWSSTTAPDPDQPPPWQTAEVMSTAPR